MERDDGHIQKMTGQLPITPSPMPRRPWLPDGGGDDGNVHDGTDERVDFDDGESPRGSEGVAAPPGRAGSRGRPWLQDDSDGEPEEFDASDDGEHLQDNNPDSGVETDGSLPTMAATTPAMEISIPPSPSTTGTHGTPLAGGLGASSLDTASAFLLAVHGEAASNDAKILIWTKPSKVAAFFANAGEAAAHAIAAAGNGDVYFGCARYRAGIPSPSRGSAKDTVGITCLWADIDIRNSVAHAKENLPPDEAAALTMVARIGLPPSIIVRSGYGLHVYWLLDQPLTFTGLAERESAKEFLKRWGDKVKKAASDSGYKVDSVFDLARVFRVPGTLNHKGETPRPVVIHPSTPIMSDLVRYTIQQVEAVMVPKPIPASPPQLSRDNPALDVTDEDIVANASVARNGKKFRPLWEGEWEGTYKSPSQADFALCGILAFWTGPDPDRIDVLFRKSKLFRAKWDEPHCADKKTYGRHTIDRALRGKTNFYRWPEKRKYAANAADGSQEPAPPRPRPEKTEASKAVPATPIKAAPGEDIDPDRCTPAIRALLAEAERLYPKAGPATPPPTPTCSPTGQGCVDGHGPAAASRQFHEKEAVPGAEVSSSNETPSVQEVGSGIGESATFDMPAEARAAESVGPQAASPSAEADSESLRDIWAARRNEVFPAKLIVTLSTNTKGPGLRAWIELLNVLTRAGMGHTVAACLIQMLWKAGDNLDHEVSIAATARDIGIGRPWAMGIKGQLCSLGIIKQTGEVRNRGVLLRFRRHDDLVKLIEANRAAWKRRPQHKERDDNAAKPPTSRE